MELSRIKPNGDDVKWVAVAIRRNPSPYDNIHVAVAYRDTGSTLMAHMCDHEKFVGGEVFDPTFFCVVPNLDDILAESFADYCSHVSRANTGKAIPYSFCYTPCPVFNVDGEWAPPTSDEGLNCSSFVLRLFKSYKIDLINLLGWPQRTTDKDYMTTVAKGYAKSKNPSKKARAATLTTQAKSYPRVRPEETAGACLVDQLPATHIRCLPIGEKLARLCTQHRTKPITESPKVL